MQGPLIRTEEAKDIPAAAFLLKNRRCIFRTQVLQ